MEEDNIQILRRSGDWVKYPIKHGDMSVANTEEAAVDKLASDSNSHQEYSELNSKDSHHTKSDSSQKNLNELKKDESLKGQDINKNFPEENLNSDTKEYTGEHEILFAQKTKNKLLPLLYKIEKLSDRKEILLEEVQQIDSDLNAVSENIKNIQEKYEAEVKGIQERFEMFETSLSLINKMIERK